MEEIKTLVEMKEELERTKEYDAKPFDPVLAVEQSLFEFLQYRLNRLRSDMEFQDKIKEFLLARMTEADFNDLRYLLEQEQKNTNATAQSIAIPFTPRMQEVDKVKHRSKQVEEEIFDSSSKENLQAVNEMFQLFNEIKKKMNEKKDTSNIKKVLEESVDESS